MAENDAPPELSLLRAEYSRLTAEIRSRYDHYYHFHYLIFVTAGALSAVYFGFNEPALRNAVFLLIPMVLIPVMLLMLKEHAYMDLREAYIRRVLAPRADWLLGRQPGDESGESFCWSSWEETSVRKARRSSWTYGLFGVSEFLLPMILSIWALFAYRQAQPIWTTAVTTIFNIEVFALCLTIAFSLLSRLARPHLPAVDIPAADEPSASELESIDQE